MNLAARNTGDRSFRKLVFAAGFLLAAAACAVKFSEYVLNDDLAGLAYVGLICIAATFVVAILNDWRQGVYFFFVWLVFEDFARKFLGNNMMIYFAKDILVGIVYLSYFIALRRKTAPAFRPPFLVPLLLFVWFGIMQVFNPSSTTLVYGVLGVKLFFSYIPLMFLGYALFNSETDLRKFFRTNSVLVLIIAGLGVAQSILGPSFLNPSRPADEIRELSTLYRVSPVTGAIAYRATSVFVSAGRYTNFLLVFWIIVLAFSGYLLLRHRKGRLVTFLSLAVLYAAIILAGSRGVFMWSAGATLVTAVAFIYGAPWRQREVLRVFRSIQRVGLAIGLAVVALFFIFPEALLSRVAIYSETLTPGAATSELQYRTWDYPVRNFLGAFNYDRWPYGFGIGTSSLGVQYVAKIFHEKPVGVGVESGFGTLIVEMGIGGLILWLIMSGAIIVSSWRVVKKLRGSPWFPIGFCIFLFTALLLLPMTFASMVMYQDFLVNAYFWLLLGILFRLPSLALSAQFANVAAPQRYQPVFRRTG